MRVDRVEVRNFGSHRHTVLEPGDARLVVIQGPNGVGKTTLASEALGHALYKDDRGSVNAGVRNGATDSAVSIDFTFAGKSYRAIRRRTTKGAGKSSADLQVRGPDGAWIPVASGDKEVPAAVRELLRMDAATFRTSVSLAQKDLDRFVAATAAGRKEVLAAIVVDPRFAPAAKLASDRARDVDARTRAERDQVERMDDVIAELAPRVGVLAAAKAEAETVGNAIGLQTSARTGAEDRLRALEAKLAAAAGVAEQIGRAEAEITALLARYNGVRSRMEASTAEIRRCDELLEGSRALDDALTALPGAKAEVERLAAAEGEERRLAALIQEQRGKVLDLERPYEQAYTAFVTRRDAAAAKVAEAEAHGKAGTSVCEACGQAIGRDTALAQLAAARAALKAIVEPTRPVAIDREQGKLTRLESLSRELKAPTPAAMAAARTRLADVERTAGRFETLGQARITIEREQNALVAGDAEMSEISDAGSAARKRLEELQGQQASLVEIETERDGAMLELTRIRADLEGLEVQRRELDRRIAGAEADVARLDALRAQRADCAATIAESSVELERLRKLAAAFGLKGIPARVIEGVLPELRHHSNEVLGQLFGMSIDIVAQRATADGKGIVEALDLVVTKDGAGEIEQARLSGGEGTAVSLALAIGLSRLNARRAGTAVRTLVVDEPDGLDEQHLRALGEALRTLAHQGELERIVAISHTQTLAEYADLVVELRPGSDGPELWADGRRVEPAPSAEAVAA